MEQNIETKDVQRTEYLDKNGLDMLWAKVKENTHNQVEVERNRAVTKENSIIDKIDNLKYVLYTKLENSRYNIPDRISTKYITSKGDDNDSFNVFPNSKLSFGTLYGGVSIHSESDRHGSTKEISVNYDDMRIKFTDGTPSNTYAIYGGHGVMLNVDNSSQSLLTADQSVKVIGTDITPLENGKVPAEYLDLSQYAKKTDIPEVGTSNFVSKTSTEEQQVINSILGVTGGGIQVFDGAIDDNNECAALTPTRLEFGYANNISDILLRGSEVDGYNGSKITIRTYLGNPYIKLSNGTDDDHSGGDTLTITNEGISNADNNANHVYATDGSLADLTQYAKKSEVTAGGNVDDVQVNGVSVVENKIANINPATKESLGVVKIGDGLNVADGTISVDKEFLIDMVSYGVEWDTTVADPACTRIGNMSYHKSLPIQSQYKGCLVKNGKVNYYLDPNDWSKKADGTPSVLDGTDGDVMVHIPKFYGKSGSNGNKRWVRIATTKIDSSWVEIPEMFVSAYCVTTYTDSDTPKVASVVNTTANYRGGENIADYDQYLSTDKFRTDLGKPITNKSLIQMRPIATNSGQELLCYEFYKWVFYWAYVIEYANFNSQKEFNSELTSDGFHQGGLGSGLTTWDGDIWNKYNNANPITPCGYTNEFGNFSGVKQILIPQTQINDSTIVSEKTLYTNRWRGFENPFGDIWTNLDGIVLKRDQANQESKVYTTSDSSKFGDDTSVIDVTGVEVATDGYTKEFDLRETGEIIPQLVGGSESTYKCDYHLCNAQSTEKRTLLVGGGANTGGQAGLGSFVSDFGVGFAFSIVGFRSVVRA